MLKYWSTSMQTLTQEWTTCSQEKLYGSLDVLEQIIPFQPQFPICKNRNANYLPHRFLMSYSVRKYKTHCINDNEIKIFFYVKNPNCPQECIQAENATSNLGFPQIQLGGNFHEYGSMYSSHHILLPWKLIRPKLDISSTVWMIIWSQVGYISGERFVNHPWVAQFMIMRKRYQ